MRKIKNKILNKQYILFVLFVISFQFTVGQEADPYEPDFSAPKEFENMTLVWHDEFNIDGKPNKTNWRFEKGFVRNKELQWYQPDNANCVGGVLLIEGKRDTVTNPNYVKDSKDWKKNRKYAYYTSSSIISQHLREFKYGHFEIRARIDTTLGSWPAIWTKGITGKWPNCGEIDIMEFYRYKKNPKISMILANTAYGSSGSPYGTWDSRKINFKYFLKKDKDWVKKFHIWRMDWNEKSIKLYLDDELLNSTDISNAFNPTGISPKEPFKQKHFMLLNLAIGANGGNPLHSKLPITYEVDYVRVYQKKNTALETISDNKFRFYPNPTIDVLHIDSDEEIVEIAIYDVSGKKMKNCPLQNRQINVTTLPTGFYVAKIKFNNGTVGQKYFIKK